MYINFATCDRTMAKRHLKIGVKGYHECPELDAALEYVVADIVRIGDPDYHAKGSVFPGKNQTPEKLKEAIAALQKMSDVFDEQARREKE